MQGLRYGSLVEQLLLGGRKSWNADLRNAAFHLRSRSASARPERIYAANVLAVAVRDVEVVLRHEHHFDRIALALAHDAEPFLDVVQREMVRHQLRAV